MSLSTRIAAHLPYLRRYARAVSGSQTSGDAYVAAVLEALISDVSIFPTGANDRVSLYKLFAKLFGSINIDRRKIESPYAWEKRAIDHLAGMTSLTRQAYLLVSVEGFSPSEAAQILEVSDEATKQHLDDASVEISRQAASSIMIIEDEPLIAMDIEDMVTSLGHKVTGIARTRAEALALFKKEEPGLVLADIQLADGSSGIDAVNDILKVTTIPVIFVTAFPERLLTGERPEPAFLVTKPFNPQMVKALISQALFFQNKAKT